MMTDAELAGAIFGETSETRTNASIATGTALASSSGGRVRVKVDGTQLGGDSGVMLDTTRSISAGQRVIITLYGEAHRGRRAFVSGVVGESEGGGGGDISELETRVTALESSVSSLSSSVSSLSSTVAGHTTQISSLSSQISTISGQVSSLQSDVSSLQSTVSSLSSTVSGHTSTLSSYGTRISNLESTTSSLSTQLSDLSSQVSGISSDLSELSAIVSGIGNSLASLSSTVSSLGTRMTTAEGDIDDLDTRVTALEQGGGGGDISALAARVTQCEEDIDDLQSDVSGLGTRMTSAEGSITSLQSTVSSHTSSISTLQSDVSGLTTRVGDAEGDIDDLETDMSSAQGDITSLDTRVTALEQGGGGGGWTPNIINLTVQQMWDILQMDPTHFVLDSSGGIAKWVTKTEYGENGRNAGTCINFPGGHYHQIDITMSFNWGLNSGSTSVTQGTTHPLRVASPTNDFLSIIPQFAQYDNSNSNTFLSIQVTHPQTWPASRWLLRFQYASTITWTRWIWLRWSGMIYTEAETYYGE